MRPIYFNHNSWGETVFTVQSVLVRAAVIAVPGSLMRKATLFFYYLMILCVALGGMLGHAVKNKTKQLTCLPECAASRTDDSLS